MTGARTAVLTVSDGVTHGTRADENPFEIHVDDSVERGVVHLRDHLAVLPLDELGVAHDAGVVDQHVDAAVPGHDLRGRGIDDVRFGDVDGRDVPDHDFRAFTLEGLGGGPADAGGTTGDDDDFVLKIEIHEGCSAR